MQAACGWSRAEGKHEQAAYIGPVERLMHVCVVAGGGRVDPAAIGMTTATSITTGIGASPVAGVHRACEVCRARETSD